VPRGSLGTREFPRTALKAAAGDIQAHFEVKVGHPAEQMVIYAEGHGIDHIVVGHRGHSVFERRLIGSVARRVIAYARAR